MKLRECSGIAGGNVSRVDVTELEPLWVCEYYDGPLSGAVLYDGKFRWYVLAEEEAEPYTEGWYRRYWLIELTNAQEAEERRWHDLFRQHVGTHWDHREGLEPGRVRSTETHHLFYEPYSRRTPLALDEAEVVGWFQF